MCQIAYNTVILKFVSINALDKKTALWKRYGTFYCYVCNYVVLPLFENWTAILLFLWNKFLPNQNLIFYILRKSATANRTPRAIYGSCQSCQSLVNLKLFASSRGKRSLWVCRLQCIEEPFSFIQLIAWCSRGHPLIGSFTWTLTKWWHLYRNCVTFCLRSTYLGLVVVMMRWRERMHWWFIFWIC